MAIKLEKSWVNQPVDDLGSDWSFEISGSLTAGRLIVALFTQGDGLESASNLQDDGTGGWTEIYNSSSAAVNTSPSSFAAYKIAGGDETRITGDGDSGGNITLLEFSGHAASPFDAVDSVARQSGSVSLSATASGAGLALIAIATGEGGGKTTSFSGFSGYLPDGSEINNVGYGSHYALKSYGAGGAVSAEGTLTDGLLNGALMLFSESGEGVPALGTPVITNITKTSATITVPVLFT